MQFTIYLKRGNRSLHYTVDLINITPRTEQYQVNARNKTVILQSNRPFFRNRGIKHRKPDFKLIDGQLSHHSGLIELVTAIMEALEPTKKHE